MSKSKFKSQASSSRALPSRPGATFGNGFGSTGHGFGASTSQLSYLAEQPDLSTISDPNVVVSFKNISKKDSTTKSKALEDIQGYIDSIREKSLAPDEAFLDAWVKIYPRTSIDASRRVRQLAHNIQGEICVSIGKKLLKYFPDVVGAWLAGLQDADKMVSLAANEAFARTFSTAEKRLNVQRAYQSSILQFCRDAILHETPQTLSDERATTLEDSKAKYFRVVSNGVLVVADLLRNLPPDEIDKQEASYLEIIFSEGALQHISSADSAVRRSVLRLLRIYLETRSDLNSANLDNLVQALFSKAALIVQRGSAFDYAQTIQVLSSKYPTIWAMQVKGKFTVSQLQHLVKQGSQGSSFQYWKILTEIFEKVPDAALPQELDAVKNILNAIHSGIARREEARSNLEDAWACYLACADRFASRLPADQRLQLAREMKFPFVRQFILQNFEDSQWTVSGPRASQSIASFMKSVDMSEVARPEWYILTSAFVERIQTSSPQQSKDYASSQEAIVAQGERWFSLESSIMKNTSDLDWLETIRETTRSILETSFAVLKTRNGKPYGAAAVAEAALRWCNSTILEDAQLFRLVASFAADELPNLVFSMSRDHLISMLYEVRVAAIFADAWNSTLSEILKSEDHRLKLDTLQRFLDDRHVPIDFEQPAENSQLQEFFETLATRSLREEEDLKSFTALLNSRSSAFSPQTLRDILEVMTNALQSEDLARSALQILNALFKSRMPNLKGLSLESVKPELLQNLLLLTESSDDELANDASRVHETIQSSMSAQGETFSARGRELDVIHAGLRTAGANSLTVDTLVDLAIDILPELTDEEKTTCETLLPPLDLWSAAMIPFLSFPVATSLAITNQLGGSIYLISQDSEDRTNTPVIQRDRYGFSPAFRMAQYVAQMIAQSSLFDNFNQTEQAEICRMLQLTVQLTNDELGRANANSIWLTADPAAESIALDFVASAQKIIRSWLQAYPIRTGLDAMAGPETFLDVARAELFGESKGASTQSYHNATAYCLLTSELIEIHGWQKFGTGHLDASLKSLQRGSDFLTLATFLSAFSTPLSTSPSSTRFCNELVADLTGLDIQKKGDMALRQVVFLNIIVKDHQTIVENIAKQRVVFFVKHVAPWLNDPDVGDALKAELCKGLNFMLPAMKEIYSAEWSSVVHFLSQTFSHPGVDLSTSSHSARLPLIHAALKLLATLRQLQSDEDCNDDLKDSWQEATPGLADALVVVLQQSGSLSDENNQALRITNELLSRQIALTPNRRIKHISELYALVAARSIPVQETAFNLLHRQIPAAQEQISIDAALDKTEVFLPQELLSLIVGVPTLDSIADATFDRTMPFELRGYLASWLLVFDHFQNASDKVKADYTSNIKEGGYLKGLLDFMFTFLGHSRGKPADMARFDVAVYSFDIEESPTRDLQWLLSHLYFLCLLRLPALTKSWWIECRSRAIVTSVESWTEKFFSSVIIARALKAVNDWANIQDGHSEDAILVKVNPKAKEVTASKEIDDQLMTVAIRLPNNFPLGQAVVEGVNRVAVDEKKWRSWLLNTQGVIAFSNNSIVEGLIAFRRNVTGALKGQSECAICYSIISQDKQLPTKKCGTCKNLFHGSCLFRWFKSSNSSSCPLCRNPFNYT